jgi:hypothetical protein
VTIRRAIERDVRSERRRRLSFLRLTLLVTAAASLRVPAAARASEEFHVTSVGTPVVSIENERTDYASLAVGVRLRLP